MKWKDFFSKWEFSNIKLSVPFAEGELSFVPHDEIAAWEMYVELITRIAIQKLPDQSGDEKTALDSIYSLFGTTRTILKEHGRKAQSFSKIAIIVLNQVIRPFTAKWHKVSLDSNQELGKEFRDELSSLQKELRKYAKALADIAQVEDISTMTT